MQIQTTMFVAPTKAESMAVCGVEQSRARKFLSHRGHTGGVADLMPIDNKRGFSGLDEATRRLRSLLHERGTLCAKAHPCSVKSVNNHTLQVCLPKPPVPGGTLCQSSPIPSPDEGSFLLKACSRGSGQRCFRFDLHAIMEYSNELRRAMARIRAHGSDMCPLRKKHRACTEEERNGVQPTGPARLMTRQLDRCALTLSGHTLKCGLRSWARVIDNTSHYDAVFRANMYPQSEGPSGMRTDVAYRHCHRAPEGASCITEDWLQWSTFGLDRFRVLQGTGLGIAHSGGTLLDLAIASCRRLDVFGAGMFSLGPGEDVVYQHWYDKPLTSHCRAPCLFAMSAAALNQTAGKLAGGPMEVEISKRVCHPMSDCYSINTTHAPSASGQIEKLDMPLFSSEVPHDFYFLSELRPHVLHALGIINWVWY